MSAKKIAASIALSGLLSLTSAGVALGADGTDASLNTTGPDSHNSIDVDNHNSIDVTNQNQVNVTNHNDQTATTGDASVSGNTNAGAASTGDAHNSATTTTDISIGSLLSSLPDKENENGAAGGGGLSVTNGAGAANGGGASKGGGGNLGVGGGLLPETGPANPLDVSALRKVFSPSSNLAAGQKSAGKLSGALLAGAALLSLVGAVGTAVYAGKKEASA